MKKRFVSILLVFALMLGTFAFSAFAEGTHTHDSCGDACAATANAVAPNALLGEVCPECGESTGSLYCDGDKVVRQENIASHEHILYGPCYYIIYVSTSSYTCGSCGHDWNYPGNAYHYCDEYHQCPIGIKAACTLKYSPPFEWEPVG